MFYEVLWIFGWFYVTFWLAFIWAFNFGTTLVVFFALCRLCNSHIQFYYLTRYWKVLEFVWYQKLVNRLSGSRDRMFWRSEYIPRTTYRFSTHVNTRYWKRQTLISRKRLLLRQKLSSHFDLRCKKEADCAIS